MYIPIKLEVLAIPFKIVLLRGKLVYKPPKDFYFLNSHAFSASDAKIGYTCIASFHTRTNSSMFLLVFI